MDSGWNLIRHTKLSWRAKQSRLLGEASRRLMVAMGQYINTISIRSDLKPSLPIFSTLSIQERRKMRRKKDIGLESELTWVFCLFI